MPRIRLEFVHPLCVPTSLFAVADRHKTIQDLCESISETVGIIGSLELKLNGAKFWPSGLCKELIREDELLTVSLQDPGISRKRLLESKPSASSNNLLAVESFADESSATHASRQTKKSKMDQEPAVSIEPRLTLGQKSTPNAESSVSAEDSSSQESTTSGEESSSEEESEESSSEDEAASDEITLMEEVPIEKPFRIGDTINPPLSLVGKNKKKLLEKMIDQERVHHRFEPTEDEQILESEPRTESEQVLEERYIDHEAKVVHSAVHLYDDEPPKLSASQRRRLRRKKTQLLKTLGAFQSFQNPAISEQAVSKEVISSPKKPVVEHVKETSHQRDSYSSLPDLVGFPKAGIRIAYKILEMTADYQPQISAFKEAKVLSVDCARKLIVLQNESQPAPTSISHDGEEPHLRKFDLPLDDDYMMDSALTNDVMTLDITSLMEVKVIQ